MNRRLPRFALLVVLVLSMLGVFQGGVSLNRVLAQGESCGSYHSGEEITETDIPAVGETDTTGSFQIDSIYESPKDDDSPFGQTLILLTLLPEGEISVLSNGNSIIRIDSNEVTLWNCGDDSIQIHSPNGELSVVEPDQHGVAQSGQAIIVDRQDVFYLSQGNADTAGTPTGSVQQLSYDLSTDALSNQPSSGSKITVGVMKPAKLCSGGGCG